MLNHQDPPMLNYQDPLMLNYQDPLMLNYQDPLMLNYQDDLLLFITWCPCLESDGARFYWRLVAADGEVKIFSSKMDQAATIFCHVGVGTEQKLI